MPRTPKTYNQVVWNLLPLVHALESAGWKRVRVHRENPRRDRIEWWSLFNGQRIRVEFEGEAYAVGFNRDLTLEFLQSIDTSSDEAVAQAAGCWTDRQIDAVRSQGHQIYLNTSLPIEDRAEGVMQQIRAVHQRDLYAWAARKRVYQDTRYQNPPDEATYAAHWLVATQHLDPKVIALLKRRYPLNGRSHIKTGSTQFHPQPVDSVPPSSSFQKRTVPARRA